MRVPCRLCVVFLMLGVFVPSTRLFAQTNTTAGEFSVEPPTLLSLGFDWKISGDDNRNARVDLTYRRKGDTAWRNGLPLLRLQREWVNGGPRQPNDNPLLPRFPFDYVVPNMFSGSVLNLEPDTEYECRLVLSDPDGVRGEAARTVTDVVETVADVACTRITSPGFTRAGRTRDTSGHRAPAAAPYSSSDYNAFRPYPGKDGAFEWNTPPPGVPADYKAAPVVRRFNTLKEYSDATGQETHSVLVDYDTFAAVTMPDKSDPQRLYKPDGLDFRLRPGSPAVDRGIALPSLNDGFTGRAPDIGAYESGRPVPQYGPR